MGLQESVVRIYIKIYTDLILECGFKFTFQMIHKFSYPAVILVVCMAIADKDVIVISLDKTWH